MKKEDKTGLEKMIKQEAKFMRNMFRMSRENFKRLINAYPDCSGTPCGKCAIKADCLDDDLTGDHD